MMIYCCSPVPIEGFLDDYAFTIGGLLDLFNVCQDEQWLQWADQLQRKQDQLFWDAEPTSGAYFTSAQGDANLLVRSKEGTRGATVSRLFNCFLLFLFFTRSLYLIHLFFSFRRLIPSRMRLHPPALDPFFSIFFPLQMFHVTDVFSAPSIFLVTLCISTLFPRPVALFFVKICSDSFFFQAVDIFVFQFVS